MEVKTNEEKQNTPDLDQMMLEGHPAFTGEPLPLEGDAVPGIDGTAGPDEKGNVDQPGEKTPEELAAEQAATEAAAGARKNKEDKPPETEPRFKSHEEAERGYKELQGKTTKAEQKAAELAAELDRIKNAGNAEAARTQTRANLITFATNRRKKALAEIGALDPDAADYEDQSSRILGEVDIDILEYRESLPNKKPAEAATKPTVATPATDDPGTVAKYVQDLIVKPEIGLEKDDPLFWTFAGQAPIADADGKPILIDDQIKWAVEKTKSYHNKLRGDNPAQREQEAAARSRNLQEQDLSLGRGGARTVITDRAAEGKPVSLADAIDGALEQRRL